MRGASTAVPADRALPDLHEALDPGALGARLETLWARHTRLPLRACVRVRTQYRPGERLTVVYRLDGPDVREAGQRTFAAVTATAAGIDTRLWHEDPALRASARALASEELTECVAALCPELSADTTSIDVTAVPVTYKPGVSCVLRLSARAGERSDVLFAKFLPDGAHDLARTLARLRERASARPRAPLFPAAELVSGHAIVVQRAVVGAEQLGRRVLRGAVVDAAGGGLMRSAGEAVAWLHGSGLRPRARTLADDLAELWGALAPVERLAPEVARAIAETADAIAHAGAQEESLPGHGALRTDQIVVGDDGLAFVDLDGFCASSPARDLGNLLAYLRWKTVRGAARDADVERLASAFLQGYARVRELPERASLARFEAASMLKIAARRYASLATHEWAFTPALVASARARVGS